MQQRCDKLVNVYVDVNLITKKIFYVGIGVPGRIAQRIRNKFHKKYVEDLCGARFIRRIIYKNIPASRAWEIEKQIIKKCGRLFNNTGYLTNVHEGGPLPFEDITDNHWLRGKKLKDVIPYYQSRKNKSYIEQYGEDRARDIIQAQTRSRNKTVQQRIAKNGTGLTAKLEAALKRMSERRRSGAFTENEFRAHKLTSERQKNKSMRERLDNPNYIDPRKGKSAKEIYNNPDYRPHNKGKTAEELYGLDYIDPRSKSFYIQIDDQEPVFCKGDRDFREKFKAHDILLYKLKRHKIYTIKRLKNTVHLFAHNSVIRYFDSI